MRIFIAPLCVAHRLRSDRDPVFFERLLKANFDLRIFLVVVDHRAAILQRCHDRVIVLFQARVKAGRINSAAHAQREMARRLAAGVEVLVIPAARRTINAAFLPVDYDDLVLVAALVRLGGPAERTSAICSIRTDALGRYPAIFPSRRCLPIQRYA